MVNKLLSIGLVVAFCSCGDFNMAWIEIVKNYFIVQYWRSVARSIANEKEYAHQDCKVKTFKLTQMLTEKGLNYSIGHGYYNRIPHRWVIVKGQIVDPSIGSPNYYLYNEGAL